MSNFDIDTRDISDEGLFANRKLTVAGKTLETPTRAIEPRRKRGDEEFREGRRGLNEIYCLIDGEKLRKERRGESDAIRSAIERDLKKTNIGEVNIVFLGWDETRGLHEEEIKFLITLQATYSDFLTVPFQFRLIRSISDGEGATSPAFNEARDSIEEYLRQARLRAPDKPIMGLIPAAGWVYTERLLELYDEYGVQAFTVNFDRSSPTVSTQVTMVKPLMQAFARGGLAEHLFMYGINMNDGRARENLPIIPGDDFAAFGMGFDAVGSNHVRFRAPPHVFEGEDGPTTFKFFDPEENGRKEVLLAELPEHLPASCSFDPTYVVEEAAKSEQTLRRLQKLVSTDLMAKAAKDLREPIQYGMVYEEVASTPGITSDASQAMLDVRDSFEAGQNQSALDEFS